MDNSSQYPDKLRQLLRDLECLPPARQAEVQLELVAGMLHTMTRQDLDEMWTDMVQLFGPDEGFADLLEGHLALRAMFPPSSR